MDYEQIYEDGAESNLEYQHDAGIAAVVAAARTQALRDAVVIALGTGGYALLPAASMRRAIGHALQDEVNR